MAKLLASSPNNPTVQSESKCLKQILHFHETSNTANVKDFCQYFNHGPTSQSEMASNVGNYNLLATSRLILNSVDVQYVALSWVK